ncbi:MAG: hypothetical protein WAK62_10705 [Terriglobales bacterium]
MPCLALRLDRLDSIVELVLRRVEVFFGLSAMSSHIVVVGGTGVVQLSDRFLDMVMDRVQIVPVMHSIGDRDPGNKR